MNSHCCSFQMDIRLHVLLLNFLIIMLEIERHVYYGLRKFGHLWQNLYLLCFLLLSEQVSFTSEEMENLES